MKPVEINLQLSPDAKAVSVARRSLDSLDGLMPGEKVGDLHLLVSELVTNSVRHAGLSPADRIGFRVETSRESVRVEVSDPGVGFETPPEAPPSPVPAPGPERVSGRGLYLVDQLADRWGVNRDRGLTRVWFEVAVHARDRIPAALSRSFFAL